MGGRTSFFLKYRDYILFNKNLLVSGTSAILASALVSHIHATYGGNPLVNSVIAMTTEYAVYIPFFAFLFYRDNRHRYMDPSTGKRDRAKVWSDVKKLLAAFSASEIIYAVVRISSHYQFLQVGTEAYQASILASLLAWAIFFACINAGVKLLRLFGRK